MATIANSPQMNRASFIIYGSPSLLVSLIAFHRPLELLALFYIQVSGLNVFPKLIIFVHVALVTCRIMRCAFLVATGSLGTLLERFSQLPFHWCFRLAGSQRKG